VIIKEVAQMLELITTIIFIVMFFKIGVFFLKIFGKLMGGIFGFVALLIFAPVVLAILPVIGFAFVIIGMLIVTVIVSLISAAVGA